MPLNCFLSFPDAWSLSSQAPHSGEESLFGSVSINCTVMNEEQTINRDSAALIIVSARSGNMPTTQCIQHIIAIVGRTQAQFSIKYQKRKGSGFYQSWQQETSLRTFVWGASIEWHDCVCNFLTGRFRGIFWCQVILSNSSQLQLLQPEHIPQKPGTSADMILFIQTWKVKLLGLTLSRLPEWTALELDLHQNYLVRGLGGAPCGKSTCRRVYCPSRRQSWGFGSCSSS